MMKINDFFNKLKEFERLTQDILWYESDNLDIDSLKDFSFDSINLDKNSRHEPRSIEITVFNPYDERWATIVLPPKVWNMSHDEIIKLVRERSHNKKLWSRDSTLNYLTADDLENSEKFDFGD